MNPAAECVRKDANFAFKGKDFEQAAQLYSNAIALTEGSDDVESLAKLFSNRSASFNHLGRFDDALLDARRCIEMLPDWKVGHQRAEVALRSAAALGIVLETAPSPFRVQFNVVNEDGPGHFVLQVHPEWAPIGAARFKELVETDFFNDTRFYRVVPGFMVQFGLAADPEVSKEWRAKPIRDDPAMVPNLRGCVSMATIGPNNRSSQCFINYADNDHLDPMGFAVFAQVEGDGMCVVDRLYNCDEEPCQATIREEGNSYLDATFPQLSKIVNAVVLCEE